MPTTPRPEDTKRLTEDEIWPKGKQADAGKLLGFAEQIVAEATVDPNVNTNELLKTLSKGTPAQHTDSSDLIIKRMSDHRMEAIEWLWPGKIPLRHTTLFSGHSSVGKGLAWIDIVARITQGRDFPDAKLPDGIGGEVLLLAEEDDYSEVLAPRLEAAGARRDLVYHIDGIRCSRTDDRQTRMFNFDLDMTRLEKVFEDEGDLCQLLVIDPISDYLGTGRSMKDKQDVSAVFSRINSLARKHDLAVIVVEHYTKRTDVSAKHKVGGSVAMITKPRAAWSFSELDEDDPEKGDHAMTWIKGNLGAKPKGLRYTIAERMIPVFVKTSQTEMPKPVPYVAWKGEENRTADDLLADEREKLEEGGGQRKRDKCADWLKEQLCLGEVKSVDIYQAGEDAGFKERTIKRALKEETDGGAIFECQQHKDSEGRMCWWMRLKAKPEGQF